MNEEYKDYLAISVLIVFFGTLLLVVIIAAGWFFPVILGIISILFLVTWALDRVSDF